LYLLINFGKIQKLSGISYRRSVFKSYTSQHTPKAYNRYQKYFKMSKALLLDLTQCVLTVNQTINDGRVTPALNKTSKSGFCFNLTMSTSQCEENIYL